MSSATHIDAPSRYRPTGKHRYGLSLFGLCLLSALVLFALNQLFGESIARHGGWAAISLIWIVQSFRAILDPQRFRENVYIGPPLRTIRFNAALALVAWTAIAATEIQNLITSE